MEETWQAFTLPLLAAKAQTVCSQQCMHLLVLFQEIITVCAQLSVNLCVKSVNCTLKVAKEL